MKKSNTVLLALYAASLVLILSCQQAKKQYTITAAASPSAGGVVAMEPAGGVYDEGTVVTLTASTNSGYTFSSWSNSASGTSATTTVTADADKTVTANFAAGSGGGGGGTGFTEDFESDLSAWTVSTPGTDTVALDTSVKHAGASCMKCTDNSATEMIANAARSFSSMTTGYLRFYAYFASGFGSAIASDDERTICTLNAAGGSMTLVVRNSSWNGLSFKLNGVSANSYSGTGAPTENTWHWIEIRMPAANSSATMSWWQDGNAMPDITAQNTAAWGVWSRVTLGLGYTGSGSYIQTAYFDDVMVSATGPIGQ